MAEPAVSDVELVAADGVRLLGRRRRPSDDPAVEVVVVHGFGASGDEVRTVRLADALVGAGYGVLTYDARGHGRSGGECTLGDREQLDVAAAVEAVRGDDRRVVAVGTSMGAIGVLRHAAGAPGAVDAVVIGSCPARWTLPRNARGIASAALTHTPPGRWFARRSMGVRIAGRIDRPAPPIELVGAVEVPLAIVHGRVDPFIPVADAEALHEATRDPRRLVLVDDLAHAYEPEAIAPILDAIDWALSVRSSGQ